LTARTKKKGILTKQGVSTLQRRGESKKKVRKDKRKHWKVNQKESRPTARKGELIKERKICP